MENKFSEQELIKAFKEQSSTKFGPNFVVRVMESINAQGETSYVWQPVFKFAAFNILIAAFSLVTGFYFLNPSEIGLELFINAGVLI